MALAPIAAPPTIKASKKPKGEGELSGPVGCASRPKESNRKNRTVKPKICLLQLFFIL